MQRNNEIVIFETEDNQVRLPVTVEDETVWLNRNQMSELFGRDVKTIGKHINNALKEELEAQVVVATWRYRWKNTNTYDRILQFGCNHFHCRTEESSARCPICKSSCSKGRFYGMVNIMGLLYVVGRQSDRMAGEGV